MACDFKHTEVLDGEKYGRGRPAESAAAITTLHLMVSNIREFRRMARSRDGAIASSLWFANTHRRSFVSEDGRRILPLSSRW